MNWIRQIKDETQRPRQQQTVKHQRAQIEFGSHFAALHVDEEFARAFYEHLQVFSSLDRPFRPSDRWCEDLKICDEDFIETSLEMFKHFRRRVIPKGEHIPDINTVEDLVLFVERQPYA
jgi:hypothetical protein